MLRLFDLSTSSEEEILEIIENREEDLEVINDVKNILDEVKRDKDRALRKYNKLYDKVDVYDLKVSKEEIDEAFNLVEEEFINALKSSIENIKKYHEKQLKNGYTITNENGVFMGQLITPIERVGVYVPGGTASYPSSVVMNVIPAKIAGVKEVVMVTPPKSNGKINPYILVAARLSGVDEIYKVGGAQSIGALAYGTESIKKVYKIVGPGNIYVATAKKLVFGTVDIDMVAGPSEILVIGDENANSKFIAADLMSQAEHDKRAAAILVTTSKKLYEDVVKEINLQIKELERKDIIEESLINYGMAIICSDLDKCIEISNNIAPEHLELMIDNPIEYLGKIKNAGSIFLGSYSPEPLGDYYAGPNHVLPTSGTAKFSSPLSVDSFIKRSSYLYYPKEELQKVSKEIIVLAEKEGLTAHKNSVKVRINND